jgi:hypothetical protein
MKRNGILILMAIALVMSSCKKKGCMDPAANNYNAAAEKDDGSCMFDPIVEATTLDCNAFNQTGTSYELVDKGLDIDYIVTCVMAVYCDLKIMPGVTIAFKTDAGLRVYPAGSINALGTSPSPINFTGFDAATGSWAGVFIDSDDIKNRFDNCKVQYAGGALISGEKGAFIFWAAARAEISNTQISNCADYGINANRYGGSFEFNNNTITTCTAPMFICGEYGGFISGGTFTGNATDAIIIDTYSGQNVTTPQTWTNLGVPYRMQSGYKLTTDTDWVIAPGVIMEFEPGSSLYIADSKSLKAVGTPSEKIIFRGVNPGQGAWKTIYFNGTNPLNEIAFAEVNGGGEDPVNTKGTVFTWYDAKLNIHDVSFNDNLACGVYVRIIGSTPNPNYTSSNLTFSNNTCDETSGN